MRKDGEFISLRLRMLGTLVFGFALSVFLLLIINLGARWYIKEKYLSAESVERRADKYVLDLQDYVTDNALTVNDADKISEWSKDNKYLYVLIYKDNELLFDSGAKDAEIEENKDNDDQKPPNSVENSENADDADEVAEEAPVAEAAPVLDTVSVDAFEEIDDEEALEDESALEDLSALDGVAPAADTAFVAAPSVS